MQIHVVVYNPYHLWNGGTDQKCNAFPSTVRESLIYTIIRCRCRCSWCAYFLPLHLHEVKKNIIYELFFHLVVLCVVNAWLLYRRDCKSFDVPQNRKKDLLAFRVSSSDAHCEHNKDVLQVQNRRPPKEQQGDTLS